jgi:hypothetical protein
MVIIPGSICRLMPLLIFNFRITAEYSDIDKNTLHYELALVYLG